MIVGVLLAAGGSERFGANKLLQEMADGSIVGLRAAEHLAAGVDELVVAVRVDDDATRALFDAAGFRTVNCPDAELGMGHSLACAVDARQDAGAWLVGLADMPFILPATVVRVADALRRHGGIVAPCYEGRLGHPVGFDARWKSALLAVTGDQGGRSIIEQNPDALRRIEVRDAGVRRDIDVPEDLTDC
jgi:molybdenum cofactor cytidylyltransferase